MSALQDLHGVIPALVTPLNDQLELDGEALRRLIEHVLDGGVHAVFVMGSTGEFAAFSRDERRRIIRAVVDQVAGRVPVLAGVSDSGSKLAAQNAADAEGAGADAIVSTIPYYFPAYTEQSALDHFRRISGNTNLPLIVYNIPQIVKTPVSVDVLLQLAQEGTVHGVKDSSGDFIGFQELLFRTAKLSGFRVFQGSEFELGASVLMGAHGGVMGIANLVPHLCVQVYEAANKGDVGGVRSLQRKLTAVGAIFHAGESPFGSLKAALSMIGICGPNTTTPVPSASEESRRRIRAILSDCGLIPQHE